MCIAIHKPADIALPSWTVLETCFNNNSDGAGFAYPAKQGGIRIVKGLMTFESFKSMLEKVAIASGSLESLTKVDMLLHFRIGTHGDTRAATHTHPFPVAATAEQLMALRGFSEYAMIHNGILSSFAGGYQSKFSDTMNFTASVLAPLSENGQDWFTQTGTAKLLSSLVGTANKVAIMGHGGKVMRYGDWTEDGGIYWSNTSYKYSYARYGRYADDNIAYGNYWKGKYGSGYGYDSYTTTADIDVPKDQVDTQDYVDRLALNLPFGPEDKADVLTKGNFRIFRKGTAVWLMKDAYLQKANMRIEADDYYQKADDIMLFHQQTRHCWVGSVWHDQNDVDWYDWEYVGKLTMTDPYEVKHVGYVANQYKAERKKSKKQQRKSVPAVPQTGDAGSTVVE